MKESQAEEMASAKAWGEHEPGDFEEQPGGQGLE